jgi:hypothetical protein
LVENKEIKRGYSALNTARSALSAVIILKDGTKFGEHPHVCAFMKGVFNMFPPQVRYSSIWDRVLDYLKTWSPKEELSLQKLSLKVVMLILLVSGQRPQIINSLRLNNMTYEKNCIIFKVENSQLKQGRPGYKPELLKLKSYDDKRNCVVQHLLEYVDRTEDIRGETLELFITTKKPVKAVSRDTVSRWVKSVLKMAGIDTNVFKAGSTRAASASKAKALGATIEEILKNGGWTRKSTFAKFYDKKIESHEDRTLGEVILR